MRDHHVVEIPLEVEHFLSLMFGKWSTHGLCGGMTEADWRTWCRKMIRSLGKYVSANVVTDAHHRERIQRTLARMSEAVDSPNREPELVSALVGMCLLLLGGMPDHWEKKKVNRPEHYNLDAHRTVHYCQSPQQKARLIFDKCIWPRVLEARGEPEEEVQALWDLYITACRSKSYAKFVEEFRKAHPEEFLRLFA